MLPELSVLSLFVFVPPLILSPLPVSVLPLSFYPESPDPEVDSPDPEVDPPDPELESPDPELEFPDPDPEVESVESPDPEESVEEPELSVSPLSVIKSSSVNNPPELVSKISLITTTSPYTSRTLAWIPKSYKPRSSSFDLRAVLSEFNYAVNAVKSATLSYGFLVGWVLVGVVVVLDVSIGSEVSVFVWLWVSSTGGLSTSF